MPLTLDHLEGSRSIVIDAPIDRVWAALCDPTRFSEWSPTVERSSWLEPHCAPSVGARFESRNRLPIVRRWTSVSTITDFEPPRALTFVVGHDPADPNTEWNFTLRDLDEGTEVTESWRMIREPWVVRLFYRLVSQSRRIETSVADTLDHLREAVEGPQQRAHSARTSPSRSQGRQRPNSSLPSPDAPSRSSPTSQKGPTP